MTQAKMQTFKKRRLSFKFMEQLIGTYNAENNRKLKIQPSYEYYEILDEADKNRQIVRGTLRDCYNAL